MKLQLEKVGVFFVHRIDVFALKGSVRRLSFKNPVSNETGFFVLYLKPTGLPPLKLKSKVFDLGLSI
jgi:hypothetical protein